MNPLLELDGCVEDYGMADVVRTLIEREMRIADAGSLQRGDDAVEFRDVGYRADAYPVHPAARDPVVAHEDLAEGAAAQFFRQVWRIRRVGNRAGLHKHRGCDGPAAQRS